MAACGPLASAAGTQISPRGDFIFIQNITDTDCKSVFSIAIKREDGSQTTDPTTIEKNGNLDGFNCECAYDKCGNMGCDMDELPVRHNEEKLNYILAQQVRYSVNDLSFDEPSTKANLLFQAHFDRLELPITDYITDLQSVLDQCIRILQAMIDFISKMYFENGLQSIINIINLLQMVTQQRWLDDSTLLNIPHITNECVFHLYIITTQAFIRSNGSIVLYLVIATLSKKDNCWINTIALAVALALAVATGNENEHSGVLITANKTNIEREETVQFVRTL